MTKTTLLSSLFLLLTSSLVASPVVSNVSATVNNDFVDICYSLQSDNLCLIELFISSDAGITWNVQVATVVGDIGPNISPGNKKITWGYKADLNGMGGSQFKARVCATSNPVIEAPEGMVAILAGEFLMGDSFFEGDLPERPVHKVQVSGFFIDQYLLTNQKYANMLNWVLSRSQIFVTEGVVYANESGTTFPLCNTYPKNVFSQIVWNGTSFSSLAGKENYPATSVSWYGAAAYANWRSAAENKPLSYGWTTWVCNWNLGYRLPTEAEWERAARGGSSGFRFPWTDTNNIDFNRANYYSSLYPSYDLGAAKGYHPSFSHGTSMPYTSPVGYFPANAYGLFDMVGNVWEWCNDWYDSEYYSNSPQINPTGPDSGTYKVVRGGSWSSTALSSRCAYRTSSLPSYRSLTNGCRFVLNIGN